jgi:hypothetical protein
MNTKRAVGGILVVVSLLALAAAACLVWDAGRPAEPPPTRPAPSLAATPLPTFAPYAQPSPLPPAAAGLRVTCNGYAELTLVDVRTGAEAARGSCAAEQAQVWVGLRPGSYLLRYESPDLVYHDERAVELAAGDNAKEVLLPGILEIEPLPPQAEVEVDGQFYTGATRLVYPAAQCPFTATVYVAAAGFQEDARLLRVEAGVRHVYVLALEPQPTAVPPPRTAGPTGVPVTAAPPPPAWTVEERVALVRQKLYESANCIRSENGLSPLPYLSEWQGMADEYARAWLDYFRQYGPTGMDDTYWKQQFWAVGGGAVRETAGLVLYAPDYYINTAPRARWESFDMCDPTCPQYHYFDPWTQDFLQASGMVVGLVPWQDGDMLKAAVVFGVRW